MPTVITGDATGIAAHDPVVFNAPAGAEARTASSVSGPVGPFQKLANLVKYLMTKAAIINYAETISALWTFTSGVAMASQKISWDVLGSSEFRLVMEFPGGSYKVRIYSQGGAAASPTHSTFIITFNAAWNPGTVQWDADTTLGATPSMKWMLSNTGKISFLKKSGTASWADGAWDSQVFTNPAGTVSADDLAKKSYVDAIGRPIASTIDYSGTNIGTQYYLAQGLNIIGAAANATLTAGGVQPFTDTGVGVPVRAGVLKNLQVFQSVNALAGGNVEVQVFVTRVGTGVIATGIKVTFTPGGALMSDLVNTYTVLDGDLVTIGFKNLAGVTTGMKALSASVQLVNA